MSSSTSSVATQCVNFNRAGIKNIAAQIKTLKEDIDKSERNKIEDRGEVMANLTLAYRHLEDASMRLGKTLQVLDGGVDKDTAVGA